MRSPYSSEKLGKQGSRCSCPNFSATTSTTPNVHGTHYSCARTRLTALLSLLQMPWGPARSPGTAENKRPTAESPN